MMNLFCIPKWHGLNPKVASLLYSAAQFCHRPPRNNITQEQIYVKLYVCTELSDRAVKNYMRKAMYAKTRRQNIQGVYILKKRW